MNVLSDFVRLLSSKARNYMTDMAGEARKPLKGYLIAGCALALLLGMVILKARVE